MNRTTFDKDNTKYILSIMKTTTSLKIDKNIKDKASKLASSLGLSLSTVINHSLRKFITEKKIVFSNESELNTKTTKLYKRLLSDIKNRENIVGPFDNIDDLKDSLLGK